MFINFRDTTFKEKYDKIHLNLSIVLLCGILVFASGVETATNDRVS